MISQLIFKMQWTHVLLRNESLLALEHVVWTLWRLHDCGIALLCAVSLPSVDQKSEVLRNNPWIYRMLSSIVGICPLDVSSTPTSGPHTVSTLGTKSVSWRTGVLDFHHVYLQHGCSFCLHPKLMTYWRLCRFPLGCCLFCVHLT